MSNLERGLYTVRRLTELTDDQMRELALVLIDCVEGGASVSSKTARKPWTFA